MQRLEFLFAGLLLASCVGCGATGGDAREPARAHRLSAEGEMNIGLAQGYLQTDDLKDARIRADMAMASDPGSAHVHALFGLIHQREGQIDKAAREFDKALKLAPNDGVILNAHASWLCGQGQAAQADLEYAQALLDPAFRSPFQVLSNAGRCAHGAKQWSKAESYFRRALEMSPQDRQLLFLMADTAWHQNSIMQAQAFIQRRDSLGSDAATLDLAARIEDAANNRLAAARYRQRLKNEFPNYAPTGEGARTP